MQASSLPPPPQVAGISLNGRAPYVISRQENLELCESMGIVPSGDDRAHPIYFFIATQIGMGMTVAELCAVCEFNVDDGPMIVSSKVEFSQSLLVEQAYRVTGEIVNLTRKLSRKIGVIDMLEYRLNLSRPDGTPVLVTTSVWVLPRGNST